MPHTRPILEVASMDKGSALGVSIAWVKTDLPLALDAMSPPCAQYKVRSTYMYVLHYIFQSVRHAEA